MRSVATKTLSILLLTVMASCASPQNATRKGAAPRQHPGAIAAPEPIAASVGAEVLHRGGNAVDAAVAVGFVLAVTLPSAGNIGGGGFMLVHDESTDEQTIIDYRETAPSAATRDMYLTDDG